MNERLRARIDKNFLALSEYLESRKDSLAPDALKRDSEEECIAFMVVAGGFLKAISRRMGKQASDYAQNLAGDFAGQLGGTQLAKKEETGLVGIDSQSPRKFKY